MSHMSTFYHTRTSVGVHGAGVRGWLPSLFGELSAIGHRMRARSRLRQMDDHLLEDIGLTREVADREASKPFWKR